MDGAVMANESCTTSNDRCARRPFEINAAPWRSAFNWPDTLVRAWNPALWRGESLPGRGADGTAHAPKGDGIRLLSSTIAVLDSI